MSQPLSFTNKPWPKLFITAWHIRVAAKGQILIKQSFQRFFSPLSGRNSELI